MARLDIEGITVTVTLSRRNLLALLTKLDWDESHRTIVSGNCHCGGVPVGDLVLVLRAEDDADHYRDRPEPAGPMHPRTEADIQRAITDQAPASGPVAEGVHAGHDPLGTVGEQEKRED